MLANAYAFSVLVSYDTQYIILHHRYFLHTSGCSSLTLAKVYRVTSNEDSLQSAGKLELNFTSLANNTCFTIFYFYDP